MSADSFEAYERLAPSAFSDCLGAAASTAYKPENTAAFRHDPIRQPLPRRVRQPVNL